MRKTITGIINPTQVLLIGCIALLAANLVGISPRATAQDQPGDVSFATPEGAITFYIQAVAQGNISQIMQACAVDEMSAGVRFDLIIDLVGYLTISSPAPANYPFYEEINKAQYSWQFLNQVRNLAYGLLDPGNEVLEGRTVRMDMEEAIQFMAKVDPQKLAQLQIVEIGVPVPDLAYGERNQEVWNRRAQIYGADESTERVVLFLFDGDYYIMGFQLLRYGEDWKISYAASALANIPGSGVPQATTVEEFQELIGNNGS